MYDRIVLPVDGSDDAERAARYGLELARDLDAAVDVVHVVDRKATLLARTGSEKRQLRERGEEILAAIEALASEFDHPLTTELLRGNPAARIGAYATERDADLVVMGRRGTTGLGRRLLGGVTEQVLSKGTVPVLVVPDGDRAAGEPYDRVLLTTDGSENAAAAIPHAASVATTYDASVHVLNVVDLQAAGGAFDVGGLDSEFVERLRERGRDAVEDAASELEAAAPGVSVRTAVEQTTAHAGVGAGIREYVEQNGIDLVVMGSLGRSNLQRQLLGSVASTVLRTVDVPVLVVKQGS